MSTSRVVRRRHQIGALFAGFCVVAGSIGSAALADSGSGTSASVSVSVDANVLVQAGLSPVNARQAASKLNAAIDAAAQTVASSAAAAVRSGKPVRTTTAATNAFATRVDGALTTFVTRSVTALSPVTPRPDTVVVATLAALAEVVRTVPGAVGFTAGAEFAVASGGDGTSASASLNPRLDTALRKTVSDSVHALQGALPISRSSLQATGRAVRAVVDASGTAVATIVRATVDYAAALVDVTAATLRAAAAVADSAVAAIGKVVAAADAALDNLSDVHIADQVDISLGVAVH